MTKPCNNAERKVQRELFAVEVEGSNDLDTVLDKFGLRNENFCVGLAIHTKLPYPSEKIKLGSLDHKRDCGSRAVLDQENTAPENEFNHRFANDKGQLNLQLNCDGVYGNAARANSGRVPGLFIAKLVPREHVTTLHGGIGLTIAKVRERYWVPRMIAYANS